LRRGTEKTLRIQARKPQLAPTSQVDQRPDVTWLGFTSDRAIAVDRLVVSDQLGSQMHARAEPPVERVKVEEWEGQIEEELSQGIAAGHVRQLVPQDATQRSGTLLRTNALGK
jgi:hypothetical protein